MVNLARVAMDNPARAAIARPASKPDLALPARDSVDMVHLRRVAIKTSTLTKALLISLHSIDLAPRATLPFSAKVTRSVLSLSALDLSQINLTISVLKTKDMRLPTSQISASKHSLATASVLTTMVTVRTNMVSKVASPSTISATLLAARASSQAPASALSHPTTQVSASITVPLVVVTSSATSSPTTPATTRRSAKATRLPHSAFLRAIGAVLPPSERAPAGEQRVQRQNLRG